MGLAAPTGNRTYLQDQGKACLDQRPTQGTDQLRQLRRLPVQAHGQPLDLAPWRVLLAQLVERCSLLLRIIAEATAEIGIIAINAIPDSKPGDWKLSVSLPTPITWKNAAGQTVAHARRQIVRLRLHLPCLLKSLPCPPAKLILRSTRPMRKKSRSRRWQLREAANPARPKCLPGRIRLTLDQMTRSSISRNSSARRRPSRV